MDMSQQDRPLDWSEGVPTLTTEQRERDKERIRQALGSSKRHALRKWVPAVTAAAAVVSGLWLGAAQLGGQEARELRGTGTPPFVEGDVRGNPASALSATVSVNAYVVYDGAFYVATGEPVADDQLGAWLGETKLNDNPAGGTFENFQSRFFAGSLRQMKGVSPQKAFAAEYYAADGVERYTRVERAAPLSKAEVTTLRNNGIPLHIGITLENIKALRPGTYLFQGDRQIHSLFYESVHGPEITVFYRFNGKGNQIVTLEYEKGAELQGAIPRTMFADRNGAALSPGPVRQEFDLNGIHWKLYSPKLLRGEKDGRFYEVQADASFTQTEVLHLLQDFQPSS